MMREVNEEEKMDERNQEKKERKIRNSREDRKSECYGKKDDGKEREKKKEERDQEGRQRNGRRKGMEEKMNLNVESDKINAHIRSDEKKENCWMVGKKNDSKRDTKEMNGSCQAYKELVSS